MIGIILSIYLMVIARLAAASILMGFPFNEQLPNVARVGDEYLFTMANTTYRSTDGSVLYSASGLPSWLSFDGASRTFTGTPEKDDIGTFEFTLTGTDSVDNSQISRNYSMLVTNDSGLRLSADDVIFVEISRFGRTNGHDGLVVQPGQNLNILFSRDTFEADKGSNASIKAYYGRSSDRSSLPNWVTFDSDTLTFSGTVPNVVSEVAPSFEFGFSFIATDHLGYAAAEGLFKVVLGAHVLSTSLNETIKVNGTLGDSFDIEIPILSEVYLDDEIISRDNISSVYADNLPDYVTLDDEEYNLIGNFPNSSTLDNFSIIVDDTYGNSVELPYYFDAIGSVFTVKRLSDVNATRGEFFSYQLLKSIFTNFNDTKISVDYDSDWLSYDKTNRTFSGNVPKSFTALTIGVTAESSYDKETKKFRILGLSGSSTTSSTKLSTSATKSGSSSTASGNSSTSSASSVANGEPDLKSSGVNRKALAIGLGVGIPLFLIFLALFIFLACFFKRRKRQTNDIEDSSEKQNFPNIDGPSGGVLATGDRDQGERVAVLNARKLDEKEKGFDGTRSTSSSITHVQSESEESNYFDAEEKPQKSWRAKDTSDAANILKAKLATGNYRDSDASMSTVNTDKLFSVRLVDDNSYRTSNQSSLGSENLLNRRTSQPMREDSGNIQRLDSFGNVVAFSKLPSPDPRSPHSSNLNILMEEPKAADTSNDLDDTTTIYREDGNLILSTDTSMNLLAKFDASKYDASPHSDDDNSDSFDETQSHVSVRNDINSGWTPSKIDGSKNQISPNRDSQLTRLSFANSSIDELLPNRLGGLSNASLDDNAKLVSFTRKSSMRDSSYEPNFHYEGEAAQIHDRDSI